MSLASVEAAGHRCVRVAVADLVVDIALDFGPRIVGFGIGDGPNLLAVLPDAGIDLPDGGFYAFRGGHRLWVSPEVPEVTYLPDDEPVAVWEDGDGVAVAGGGELAKEIKVGPGPGGSVAVTHTITNQGDRAAVIAAWALTQLPAGGVAVMPLSTGTSDAHGLQASRTLVGWPYTDFSDDRIEIRRDHVLVEGRGPGPIKLGTRLDREWLAYVYGEWVFVKRTTDRSGPVPDLDADGQVYATDEFVELETLGPLATIQPGESVHHVEYWEAHASPSGDTMDRVVALRLDGGTA